MITRRHARRLALAALALAPAMKVGEADATSHKQRHAAPVTPSHEIENETTGTIPAKPPPRQAAGAPTAASQDDETLPPPFHLPTASRKRMRDCGLKWQAMKMSGEAGDNIWRAFATRCLAAADSPFNNKHTDQ